MLREFPHNGKLAKNFRQSFRVAGACRGFSVVLGELERIGQEECIEARCGASAAVGDRQACKAFFLGAQMKLRKKMVVLERGGHDAFAEIGDGFRNRAHALFLFRREKKRTQERAVDTVAESEVCAAQPFKQVFRERGKAQERGFQNFGPILCRIGRSLRRCRSAGHFALGSGDGEEKLAAWRGANDWSAAMLLGAPVNPLAAPTPSISSQRGHGFETSPCRARSMTRRAILSTTCSK